MSKESAMRKETLEALQEVERRLVALGNAQGEVGRQKPAFLMRATASRRDRKSVV